MARDLFAEAGIVPDAPPAKAAPRDLFAEAGINHGGGGIGDLKAFAVEEARRQGVDPSLVMSVTGNESSWDPKALSKKGAIGPMQLMPGTAKDLGVNPHDPHDNIRGGIKYLKQQLDASGGDVDLALARYNAGSGAVAKAGGIPNYRETKEYIQKVKGNYRQAANAPATLQFGPWDTGIGISPSLNAGLARAGGAALDAVNGVKGLFGFGDSKEEVADRALANEALFDTHPVAATIGNIGANAGMMYAGGGLLGASGELAALRGAPAVGKALSTIGQSVRAPQGLLEATAGGGVYGGMTNNENRGAATVEGALGGGAGYGAGKLIGSAASAIGQKATNLANKFKPMSAADLDNLIVSRFGFDPGKYQSIPDAGKQAIRDMTQKALASGKDVTPEMLQRVADFKTSGIEQPLRGWVTRDPQEWVQAHELQGVAPEITKRWSGASSALAQKLQGMAPDSSDYALGSKFSGGIQGKDAELKKGVDAAYQRFREMGGKDVPLDVERFNNAVAMDFYQNMNGGKVPQSINKWFADIAEGKEPFTFSTGAQRLEALNKMIRNSNDKSERYALGTVKRHLEDAISGWGEDAVATGLPMSKGPVIPKSFDTAYNPETAAIGPDYGLEGLAGQFKQARTLAKNRFDYLQSSPLHESVTSGEFTAEKLPDLIKNIGVDNLKKMAATDAQYGTNSLGDLKEAAAAFIRDSAVLQGETGGKFSQAGLRRAIDKIGPENGKLLFGEQWEEINAALRAGGAMMNQPAGVIAANSGTGQMIARMITSMPKIPGTGPLINLGAAGVQAAKRASAVNGQLGGVPFQSPGLLGMTAEQMRNAPGGVPGLLGYYGATGGQ